ncbi:hypothetical protein [Aporhodopirellula aestuarii]|uniref:Uncharacterized protein n=1 Tax=Aporhodopirellula aestuarii TaxID=2950107 RepID=A0ABT0TXX6_9BACT|nr:hypothetical protein [Aporhodopirellula aestuarii]MCM2369439.1 hypothetical protein [Aporhodopirellula aestuarii]
MAGSNSVCDMDFLALAFSTIARTWQPAEERNAVVYDAERPLMKSPRHTRKEACGHGGVANVWLARRRLPPNSTDSLGAKERKSAVRIDIP